MKRANLIVAGFSVLALLATVVPGAAQVRVNPNVDVNVGANADVKSSTSTSQGAAAPNQADVRGQGTGSIQSDVSTPGANSSVDTLGSVRGQTGVTTDAPATSPRMEDRGDRDRDRDQDRHEKQN